ncbi:hypothetical protein BDN72DRAFT_904935 [Pluteus cervinus]|uniref:Uncharacterized protein n=1 Tax=Pluteus cervinus TaxID=181527 RepID=A0ACD3A3R2_9AGAR|nr:hypothetical protein BDN72DRAFT_904935 [Pluteus cervinus]
MDEDSDPYKLHPDNVALYRFLRSIEGMVKKCQENATQPRRDDVVDWVTNLEQAISLYKKMPENVASNFVFPRFCLSVLAELRRVAQTVIESDWDKAIELQSISGSDPRIKAEELYDEDWFDGGEKTPEATDLGRPIPLPSNPGIERVRTPPRHVDANINDFHMQSPPGRVEPANAISHQTVQSVVQVEYEKAASVSLVPAMARHEASSTPLKSFPPAPVVWPSPHPVPQPTTENFSLHAPHTALANRPPHVQRDGNYLVHLQSSGEPSKAFHHPDFSTNNSMSRLTTKPDSFQQASVPVIHEPRNSQELVAEPALIAAEGSLASTSDGTKVMPEDQGQQEEAYGDDEEDEEHRQTFPKAVTGTAKSSPIPSIGLAGPSQTTVAESRADTDLSSSNSINTPFTFKMALDSAPHSGALERRNRSRKSAEETKQRDLKANADVAGKIRIPGGIGNICRGPAFELPADLEVYNNLLLTRITALEERVRSQTSIIESQHTLIENAIKTVGGFGAEIKKLDARISQLKDREETALARQVGSLEEMVEAMRLDISLKVNIPQGIQPSSLEANPGWTTSELDVSTMINVYAARYTSIDQLYMTQQPSSSSFYSQ